MEKICDNLEPIIDDIKKYFKIRSETDNRELKIKNIINHIINLSSLFINTFFVGDFIKKIGFLWMKSLSKNLIFLIEIIS